MIEGSLKILTFMVHNDIMAEYEARTPAESPYHCVGVGAAGGSSPQG